MNVGEADSVLRAEDGPFVEVADVSLVDLTRIPDDVAVNCLDRLHGMILAPSSKVYVHCIAGWNRSPTIVWLYLVACGIDPDMAKQLIASQNLDAVPGHPRLVDSLLVTKVQSHGRNYLPHPRPEAIGNVLRM